MYLLPVEFPRKLRENLRAAAGKQDRPKKSAKDQTLDDLAEWMRAHPDLDSGKELLTFFKKTNLPVGKLLYRLRR